MADKNLKRRITVRFNEDEYRFIEEVVKKTGGLTSIYWTQKVKLF